MSSRVSVAWTGRARGAGDADAQFHAVRAACVQCTAEVRHGILEKQGEPYRYRRRRVIGDHGDDHQLSGIAIHVGIRRQPWHVPNTVRCLRASRGQRLEALGLCRSFGRGRGRPDVVRFLATGWYGSSGRYPCR